MKEPKRILSWLPSQESDKRYPLKDVIIIEEGKSGYSKADCYMSKETIIEKNNILGTTERDRIIIEAKSYRKQ